MPYPAYGSSGLFRPTSDISTCATETAGAGGLKIAETFPEAAGAARMDAGWHRVLHGRCLGPTRSLQG